MALPLADCSRQVDRHHFETVIEDGVITATTNGDPLYNTPPFWLEEETRIHQDPAIGASLLRGRGPMVFGPGTDSTLVVAERDAGRVAIYDSKGRFLQDIGSPGSGPGQFRAITHYQVIGDSLVFYDHQLRRISVYSGNGGLIETISTNRYGLQHRVELLPDDKLAIAAFLPPVGIRWMEYRVQERSTGDTLAHIRTEAIEYRPSAWLGERVIAAGRVPFAGEPFVQSGPGSSLLLGSAPAPEVWICDILGKPFRRIRLVLPPREVTVEMKSTYWEEEELRRAMSGGSVSEREKARFRFTRDAGWWIGGILDDQGFLWLQDAINSPFRFRPSDFFVFNREGRYLGRVTLPSEARPEAQGVRIYKGRLYAVVVDTSTGGLIPIVYRIRSTFSDIDYYR